MKTLFLGPFFGLLHIYASDPMFGDADDVVCMQGRIHLLVFFGKGFPRRDVNEAYIEPRAFALISFSTIKTFRGQYVLANTKLRRPLTTTTRGTNRHTTTLNMLTDAAINRGAMHSLLRGIVSNGAHHCLRKLPEHWVPKRVDMLSCQMNQEWPLHKYTPARFHPPHTIWYIDGILRILAIHARLSPCKTHDPTHPSATACTTNGSAHDHCFTC